MALDPETWYEMLKSDDIQVSSEEDVVDAVLRFSAQFEEEKRLKILEKLLPCIRFPVLGPDYIVEKFEQNPALQAVPNLHTLLHETYKYKAYPTAPTKYIKTRPRKGTMMWDTANPDFSLSSDKLTATNDHRQNIWSNVRCLPMFPDGISYREFKVKFTSYIMVGVETKDNSVTNRTYNQYPGQTTNGWSWYSAGQTYHANVCNQTQAPFSTGDTVGILLDTVNGKLQFYRNGTTTNANFSNLPKGKEFYAVMSTYSQGDSVTIIPGRNFPKKLPTGWDVQEAELKAKRKTKAPAFSFM
jgi:hypothetical protein